MKYLSKSERSETFPWSAKIVILKSLVLSNLISVISSNRVPTSHVTGIQSDIKSEVLKKTRNRYEVRYWYCITFGNILCIKLHVIWRSCIIFHLTTLTLPSFCAWQLKEMPISKTVGKRYLLTFSYYTTNLGMKLSCRNLRRKLEKYLRTAF